MWVTGLILVATVAQLLVATFVATDLPQFEGKGFGARLVAYPVMMLARPGDLGGRSAAPRRTTAPALGWGSR